MPAVISSVSYVQVGATADHVELGFSASYIDIAVAAQATFPDRFLVEVFTPTDAVRKSVTKGALDTFNLADDTSNEVAKATSDTVVMEDDTDIEFLLGKILADVQSLSDAKVVAVAKALVDLAVASDAKAISLSRALADSGLTLADLATVDASKSLSDSAVVTETLIAVRLFVRDFIDELVMSEANSLAITKAPFNHSVGTSDTDTYSFSKPVSESVVMIDNMDGDIQYQVVKVIGELLSAPTDLLVRSTDTTKSESVAISTSGVAFMTDYADISYFAEDYVGVSSTFS